MPTMVSTRGVSWMRNTKNRRKNSSLCKKYSGYHYHNLCVCARHTTPSMVWTDSTTTTWLPYWWSSRECPNLLPSLTFEHPGRIGESHGPLATDSGGSCTIELSPCHRPTKILRKSAIGFFLSAYSKSGKNFQPHSSTMRSASRG